MDSLPEFVGTVHIFLGPYRGNPIALYMKRDETACHIAPRIYPWNRTVGSGETPNKAAADFEAKWKANDLSEEMYSGPHWEGGIKPEKPKPPPKPAAPKPAAAASPDSADPKTASASSTSSQPPTAEPSEGKGEVPPAAGDPSSTGTLKTASVNSASPAQADQVEAPQPAPTSRPEPS